MKIYKKWYPVCKQEEEKNVKASGKLYHRIALL